MGTKVGVALADIKDLSQLISSIASASNAMAGVQPTDFQSIIGKTTVDSTFLAAFNDTPMTYQYNGDSIT